MLSTTELSAESVNITQNTKLETLSQIFTQEQHLDDSKVINDGVMGGLSVGKTQLENQFLFFLVVFLPKTMAFSPVCVDP